MRRTVAEDDRPMTDEEFKDLNVIGPTRWAIVLQSDAWHALYAEADRARKGEAVLLEAIRVGAARVAADPSVAVALWAKLAKVVTP